MVTVEQRRMINTSKDNAVILNNNIDRNSYHDSNRSRYGQSHRSASIYGWSICSIRVAVLDSDTWVLWTCIVLDSQLSSVAAQTQPKMHRYRLWMKRAKRKWRMVVKCGIKWIYDDTLCVSFNVYLNTVLVGTLILFTLLRVSRNTDSYCGTLGHRITCNSSDCTNICVWSCS